MMGENVKFGRVGSVFVEVFAREPTKDEESAANAALVAHVLAGEICSILVHAPNLRPPDPAQRARMKEALGGRAMPKTAVLNDAPVAALALKAFDWLWAGKLQMRLFATRDLDGAFSYLDVAPDDRARLRLAVIEFRVALGMKAS
jgi:hypothetical protein